MADCCGGKNAGKRISWFRYFIGLSVFLGYHSVVLTTLYAAALPFPKLKKVRDFQRTVFMTELREILRLEDINVNGRLDVKLSTQACEVNEVPVETEEPPRQAAG